MTTTPELKEGLYKFKDSSLVAIIKDRRLGHWDSGFGGQWKNWQGETGFAKVERILEAGELSLTLPIEYLT